jgi:hypothetical protein
MPKAGTQTITTKNTKEAKIANITIIKPVPFNLTIRPTDSFF